MNRVLLALAFLLFSSLILACSPAAGLDPRYIAVSDTDMTWTRAVQWCSDRGGRLPKINGSDSLPGSAVNEAGALTINGIGEVNITDLSITPWEATGLPSYVYWSGTVYADSPNTSWFFGDDDGLFSVYHFDQSGTLRVVCVP